MSSFIKEHIHHIWWLMWWLLTIAILLSPVPAPQDLTYNEIIDKFIHAALFLILGILVESSFYREFTARRVLKTLIAVLLICIVTGTCTELLQGMVLTRDMDPLDFLADMAGTLLAILIFVRSLV